MAFLLLKCSYGDNSHVQENKSHYTGPDANSTRRAIYKLWQSINKLELSNLHDVRPKQVGLELDRYVLVNSPRDPTSMSTQQTGNTCYFQTYLFALLCKVGGLSLGRDGGIGVQRLAQLEAACVACCRHLLQFFVVPPEQTEAAVPTGTGGALGGAGGAGGTGSAAPALPLMRPLTNSNVVLDFRRYEDAAYYTIALRYLRSLKLPLPDYEAQHAQLLAYYRGTRLLHGYDRFRLEGAVASTARPLTLSSSGTYLHLVASMACAAVTVIVCSLSLHTI